MYAARFWGSSSRYSSGELRGTVWAPWIDTYQTTFARFRTLPPLRRCISTAPVGFVGVTDGHLLRPVVRQ